MAKKQNVENRVSRWGEFVCSVVLISAFLPKLILSDGVNVYLPELVIFLSLFVYGIKQFFFFKEQRILAGLFGAMVIFSIVSLASVEDSGSILRSVKEILYIAIIFWASKISDPEGFMKKIVLCASLAMVLNILMFAAGYSIGNSIWGDADALSSGMSNKGFSLADFQIQQLPGLAHGIWGSYCVLSVVVATTLYKRQIIGKKSFLLNLALFLINMAISVSRESILILIVVILCFIIFSNGKLINKIFIVGFAAIAVAVVIQLGDSLPLFQKITYMIDSFSSGNTDGNIQIRINTWAAYGDFVLDNLHYLFMGLGISPENFYEHIKNYSTGEIVSVPESAFVYVQAYGGLLSTICMVLLIITCGRKISGINYKLIKYFFVGLLLTNLFSGVSMFSDLLYAHLCLIYGIVVLNKKKDENFAYNS